MAKGNKILVVGGNGRYFEALAGEAFSPGNLLQINAATEPDGSGMYTVEEFDGAADGERAPVIVALENNLAGKTSADAYAANDVVQCYMPLPGDELNVMVQASAGALAIGDKMIFDDGTGTLIKTTGTPESEPFQVLETASDPAADALYHMLTTGN